MKKFKINISFFLTILVSLMLKKFILLANYMLALFLHELAHLLVATKRGYSLKIARLSMFGLTLDLNEKIEDKDQFAINIAGPIFNLLLCLVCVASYWIFPLSYQYLNMFCFANLTLAIFNLLPIYPLDGGKIFYGIVKNEKVFKWTSLLIKLVGVLIFTTIFVMTYNVAPNYMMLVIAIFFLTTTTKRNPTMSIYKNGNNKNLDKVVIVKVGENVVLIDLLKKIKAGCFTIFYFEKSQKFVDENQVVDLAMNNALTSRFQEIK